ncbi:NAD/FAD-dependent oxidoreductase [cyanobiont of Ornithocercus magnificus]|nr:NAD/FAD-dependent oxidoreductase [cyanobiont of Ornithocercus magnificus]
MIIFSFLLKLLIAITPPSNFTCDGALLNATIRNSLDRGITQVDDLEKIDEGSFVVLRWKNISLMLPVSFQAGEISFTDKSWLWSYQDSKRGLTVNTPRFAHRLPTGSIAEYECKAVHEE